MALLRAVCCFVAVHRETENITCIMDLMICAEELLQNPYERCSVRGMKETV